jgi:MoxR-like ATPase
MQSTGEFTHRLKLKSPPPPGFSEYLRFTVDTSLQSFLRVKPFYTISTISDDPLFLNLSVSHPLSQMGMCMLLIDMIRVLEKEGCSLDEASVIYMNRDLVRQVEPKYHPDVDYLAFINEWAIPKLSESRLTCKKALWRFWLCLLVQKLLKEVDKWPFCQIKEKAKILESYRAVTDFLFDNDELLEKRSKSRHISPIATKQAPFQALLTTISPKIGDQGRKPPLQSHNNRLEVPLKKNDTQKKIPSNARTPRAEAKDNQSFTSDAPLSQFISQQASPVDRPEAKVARPDEIQKRAAPDLSRDTRQIMKEGDSKRSAVSGYPQEERAIVEKYWQGISPQHLKISDQTLDPVSIKKAVGTAEFGQKIQIQTQTAGEVLKKDDLKGNNRPDIHSSSNPFMESDPNIRSSELSLKQSSAEENFFHRDRFNDSELTSAQQDRRTTDLLSQPHNPYNEPFEHRGLKTGPPADESFILEGMKPPGDYEDQPQMPTKIEWDQEKSPASSSRLSNDSKPPTFVQPTMTKKKEPQPPSDQANLIHNLALRFLEASSNQKDKLRKLSKELAGQLTIAGLTDIPSFANQNSRLIVKLMTLEDFTEQLKDNLLRQLEQGAISEVPALWKEISCVLLRNDRDFLKWLHNKVTQHHDLKEFLRIARGLLLFAHRSLSPGEDKASILELLCKAADQHPTLMAGDEGKRLAEVMFEMIDSTADLDAQIEYFFCLFKNSHVLPTDVKTNLDRQCNSLRNKFFPQFIMKAMEVYQQLDSDCKPWFEKSCFMIILIKGSTDLFRTLVKECTMENSRKRAYCRYLTFIQTCQREQTIMSERLEEVYQCMKYHSETFLQALNKGDLEAALFNGLQREPCVEVFNLLLGFKINYSITDMLEKLSAAMKSLSNLRTIRSIFTLCIDTCNFFNIRFGNINQIKKIDEAEKNPTLAKIEAVCSQNNFSDYLVIGSVFTSELIQMQLKLKISVKMEASRIENYYLHEFYTDVREIVAELKTAFFESTGLSTQILDVIYSKAGVSHSRFQELMIPVFENDSRPIASAWVVYLLNLFLSKKATLKPMLARIGEPLRKANVVQSIESQQLWELESKHVEPPKFGHNLSQQDEAAIVELLELQQVQDELAALFDFAVHFNKVETREAVNQMVVDGALISQNITFEEYRHVKTFLNVFSKTIQEKRALSTPEFARIILKRLLNLYKTDNPKESLKEVREIASKLRICLNNYCKRSDFEKNLLEKIITNSIAVFATSKWSQEVSIHLLVDGAHGPTVVTWAQTEELKIKLIIAGHQIGDENLDSMKASYLLLLETLAVIRRDLTFIHLNSDILDLKRAVETQVPEALRDSVNQETTWAARGLEIKCRKNGPAIQSTEVIQAVQKALQALCIQIRDPRLKREMNIKARLRLFLTNTQKQLLAHKIITLQERELISGTCPKDIASILHFATGLSPPFSSYLAEVHRELKDREDRAVPIFSTTILESLSKKLLPIIDARKETTRGKAFYSTYTTQMTECLLVHLAKFNSTTSFIPNKIWFCSHDTTASDLELFIERALTDANQDFYYIVDLQLLPQTIFKAAVDHLKFMFSDKRNYANDSLLLLLDAQAAPSFIKELNAQPDLLQYIDSIELSEAKIVDFDSQQRFEALKKKIKAVVVVSPIAGLGKSTFITAESASQGQPLITVHFSGEADASAIERRFEILERFLDENDGLQAFNLHIKLDMMDSMVKNIQLVNQLLLQICFFKVVPYKNSYLFLSNLNCAFIEISNNYRQVIMAQLSLGRIAEVHSCPAFDATRVECRLLQNGDRQSLTKVVAYWRALKTKISDGKGSRIIEVCALVDSDRNLIPDQDRHRRLTSDDDLRKALHEILMAKLGTHIQRMSYFSYSQVAAFVEIAARQLEELDNVSALMPSIAGITEEERHLRSHFVDKIFESAFSSVFYEAHLLRHEVEATKAAMSEAQQLNPTDIGNYLELFQQRIKRVPTWEEAMGHSHNLFIRNGSLKVLTKKTSDFVTRVNTMLGNLKRLFIKEAHQGHDFLLELVQGLDLEVILTTKENQSYKRFKEDLKSRSHHEEANVYKFIASEAKRFRSKGYVITEDNYLKIMLLVQRADYSVPIVLMGATGCGKTFLVDFTVTCLLRDDYFCIGINPGTSEEEIIAELNRAITRAEQVATQKYARVWILFDEFNTSPLQSLISEIMIERKSSFSRKLRAIPNNVVFVAACNPYKIYGNTTSVGLVNEASQTLLAHRVYPIPDRLVSLIWDFGQLEGGVEEAYIKSMIEIRCERIYSEAEKTLISKVVIASQKFIREKEGQSSVSLRDISRFLSLLNYGRNRFGDFAGSLSVAAYICYCVRIDDLTKQLQLNQELRRISAISFIEKFAAVCDDFARSAQEAGFIPPDVALNKPLKENLFALVLTQAAKLPLIICGKPGTSKTLSASICISIFKGKQEAIKNLKFFHDIPSLAVVNFSGSQSTTCEAIQKCFEHASSIKALLAQSSSQKDKETLVSVFFDEVGLAEIADENPLKVLHQKLEPEVAEVGFVGISNWRLDLSKMNRVIYVSRPDPKLEDLSKPLEARLKASNLPNIGKIVASVVETYCEFREQESRRLSHHPNFHGARDVYNVANQLLNVIEKITTKVDPKSALGFSVKLAVMRNFGGIMIGDQPSNEFFMESLINRLASLPEINSHFFTPLDLIFHNLADTSSRHLMLFCENEQVEEVIVQHIRTFSVNVLGKPEHSVKHFLSCRSKEEELEVLNSLSVMINQGFTIVLKNLDAIYGILYELFNQRYETRMGVNGCHLVYNSHRQWIPVHPQFKCIVLMDNLAGSKTHLPQIQNFEKTQQPPFLNRFEKQIILQKSILNDEQTAVLDRLTQTYIEAPTCTKNILIHNLSKELILSMVLNSWTSKTYPERPMIETNEDFYAAFLRKEASKQNQDSDKNETKDMFCSSFLPTSLTESSLRHADSFQLIESKLSTLYSRNMILERYLELSDNRDQFKLFKEQFLSNHKYDNLGDLFCELASPFAEQSIHVVFTFSEAHVVARISDTYKEMLVINSRDLRVERKSELTSLLHSYLTEPSKSVVVFQFSSAGDWPLIGELKSALKHLRHEDSKPFIVLIHASLLEVPVRTNYCTRLDPWSSGWQVAVIDDLEGCNYQSFFDSLPLSCSEYVLSLLTDRSASIERSPLWREFKESLLQMISGKLLAKTTSSGAIREVSRAVESIRKESLPFSIIIRIAAGAVAEAEDSTVAQLIESDKCSRAELYLDVEQYVAALVNERFRSCFEAIVDKVDAIQGFRFLIRLALISDEAQRKFIFENRWIPILRGTDQNLDFDFDMYQASRGIYDSVLHMFQLQQAIKIVALKVGDLKKIMTKTQALLAVELVDSVAIKKSAADFVGCLSRACDLELSPEQKEDLLPVPDFESTPITSLDEVLLVAVYVVDLYWKEVKCAELSLLKTKVLMKVGKILFGKSKWRPFEEEHFGLTEGILGMLLVAETYEADLALIERALQRCENLDAWLEDLLIDFSENLVFLIDASRIETTSLLEVAPFSHQLKIYSEDLKSLSSAEESNGKGVLPVLIREMCLAFSLHQEKYLQRHPSISAFTQNIAEKNSCYKGDGLCELYFIADLLAQLLKEDSIPPKPYATVESTFPLMLTLISQQLSSASSKHAALLQNLATITLMAPDQTTKSLSIFLNERVTLFAASKASLKTHNDPLLYQFFQKTRGFKIVDKNKSDKISKTVASLRMTLYSSLKMSGYLDKVRLADKVYACEADFDVLPSIEMKLSLDGCLAQEADMKALSATLEKFSDKLDDPSRLQVLRYICRNSRQHLLGSKTRRALGLDGDMMLDRTETPDYASVLVFAKEEDGWMLSDALQAMRKENARVDRLPADDLWPKFAVVLTLIKELDTGSMALMNFIDGFCSRHQSSNLAALKDLLSRLSFEKADHEPLLGLGLATFALDSLRIDGRKQDQNSRFLGLLRHLQSEASPGHLQAFAGLFGEALRLFAHPKIDSTALNAYCHVYRNSEIAKDPFTLWTFLNWLLELSKEKTISSQPPEDILRQTAASVESTATIELFEIAKATARQIASGLQPQSVRLKEFCTAIDVHSTALGKNLGPSQCYLSDFLLSKSQLSASLLLDRLHEAENAPAQTLLAYVEHEEVLASHDELLLLLASFSRLIRDVLAGSSKTELSTILDLDLRTFCSNQPALARPLIEAHQRWIGATAKMGNSILSTLLEKNKALKDKKEDFEELMTSKNPLIGHFVALGGSRSCIIADVVEGLAELRNKLYQSVITCTGTSDTLFPSAVSFLDLTDQYTTCSLQEAQGPAKKSAFVAFLTSHLTLDFKGSLILDWKLLIECFARKIATRLRRVEFRPFISLPDECQQVQTTDLDALVQMALLKLDTPTDLAEVTVAHQKATVAMFETATRMNLQDKLSEGLKFTIQMCTKLILSSRTVRPTGKLSQVLDLDMKGPYSHWRDIFDNISVDSLAMLRKVQLALYYRECKAAISRGNNDSQIKALPEIIKNNKIDKESLSFVIIELRSQVAKILEKGTKDRSVDKIQFSEVPLEPEVNKILSGWLSRLELRAALTLQDAGWIISSMDNVRSKMT